MPSLEPKIRGLEENVLRVDEDVLFKTVRRPVRRWVSQRATTGRWTDASPTHCLVLLLLGLTKVFGLRSGCRAVLCGPAAESLLLDGGDHSFSFSPF